MSGVDFTGVSMNTAEPYIFGTGSSYVGAGPPFAGSTFPTTDLTAGDTDFFGTTPAGGLFPAVTIAAGSTVGLALVTYSASTAPHGTALINFGASTSAGDTNLNAITVGYATPAGSIVTSGAAVPEPSTFVILTSGLACVLVACGLPRTASAAARGRADARRAQSDLANSL